MLLEPSCLISGCEGCDSVRLMGYFRRHFEVYTVDTGLSKM